MTVFEDRTIRQVVHTSVGGDTLRVRLTNEFGSRPLVIGGARVARRAAGAPGPRIDPDSDRELTFGRRASVAVPPGAPLLSDPVALPVTASSDLVVSIYLPERTAASTIHSAAFQEGWVAAGDVTARPDIQPVSVVEAWYFLSGVALGISGSDGGACVVALGDSITDGADTTTNANHRWPDLLARRLRATGGLERLGVANAGIAGNRLLHDPNPPPGSEHEDIAELFGQCALRRFDRDVGAQPGARYVIVLLGANDLGHPGTVAPASEEVSAADIIGAHRQLIARAHARVLKILGGTIMPFGNDTFGFSRPEREAARQAVNAWIRTGGEFDAVADFDAALRDPDRPERLLAAYDSGDHLHPNDDGARALAGAVPLDFFR
jgi:lysophospholipase L1-like esterase